MKFDICSGVLPLDRSFGEPFEIETTSLHRLVETDAIAIGAAAVRFDTVGACECRRAEKAAAEASPFFVGPVDQANSDGRPAGILAGKPPQNLEPGDDTQGTIEPATVRHRIQMAADQQRLR